METSAHDPNAQTEERVNISPVMRQRAGGPSPTLPLQRGPIAHNCGGAHSHTPVNDRDEHKSEKRLDQDIKQIILSSAP